MQYKYNECVPIPGDYSTSAHGVRSLRKRDALKKAMVVARRRIVLRLVYGPDGPYKERAFEKKSKTTSGKNRVCDLSRGLRSAGDLSAGTRNAKMTRT